MNGNELPSLDKEHVERLDALLADRGLEAVWLANPDTFAWLTGGDNAVDWTGNVGVGAAGYDGDEVLVVTDNIEAQRLRDEELPPGVKVKAFEWHDSSLVEAVAKESKTPAAADFDVPGFNSVDSTALRQPLTATDVERYRSLGTDAATAVEEVARSLSADDTEAEVASDLTSALASYGINTPVVLVGGSDRAQRYRHYTPKDDELGDYALLSVTGRRDGLYASLTRTVSFDPPEWLTERHKAATRVEASALAATHRVGMADGTAADVFESIESAYDEAGYPGEWRNHHQGGAAGYAGREWFGKPTNDVDVSIPMAYAWNPTVQGAKSEDTSLVTEDGVEVLTTTGEWPMAEVTAVGGDLTVERPAILDH